MKTYRTIHSDTILQRKDFGLRLSIQAAVLHLPERAFGKGGAQYPKSLGFGGSELMAAGRRIRSEGFDLLNHDGLVMQKSVAGDVVGVVVVRSRGSCRVLVERIESVRRRELITAQNHLVSSCYDGNIREAKEERAWQLRSPPK